jgi:peptidyl-dipeptidase Dcp
LRQRSPLLRPTRRRPRPPAPRTNPFFSASSLPYQAPPFDRIEVADYLPAFAEG